MHVLFLKEDRDFVRVKCAIINVCCVFIANKNLDYIGISYRLSARTNKNFQEKEMFIKEKKKLVLKVGTFNLSVFCQEYY
jgi:hypothetical protein